MPDTNSVHITGVVAYEPRRTEGSSWVLCAFSVLSVDEREHKHFLPVVAWGGLARSLQGLSKGDRVEIAGKLRASKPSEKMVAALDGSGIKAPWPLEVEAESVDITSSDDEESEF